MNFCTTRKNRCVPIQGYIHLKGKETFGKDGSF